jgi:hypothetical protein
VITTQLVQTLDAGRLDGRFSAPVARAVLASAGALGAMLALPTPRSVSCCSIVRA